MGKQKHDMVRGKIPISLFALLVIAAAVTTAITFNSWDKIGASTPFADITKSKSDAVPTADTGDNVAGTGNTRETAKGIVINEDPKVPVNLDKPNVYKTNFYDNTVSVIDNSTNTVTATIPVGNNPIGVAIAPEGSKVYVANSGSNDISVIDTATNTVIDTLPTEGKPVRIEVTADGKVYVTLSHLRYLERVPLEELQ